MSGNFVFRPLEKGLKGLQHTEPLVSLHKSSVLAINRSAMELLGNPSFVTLLVDEGRRAFAIRAATESDTNGYPVRKQKTSSGVLVSGKRLVNELGLQDMKSALRFHPTQEGKMLIVVLERNIVDEVNVGEQTS